MYWNMLMVVDKKSMVIQFAQHELILHGMGCFYWPHLKILVIADLHLEKGSYFANKGNPLPLFDTYDTLKRIECLIECYKPDILISLGDNIHDQYAFKRIRNDDYLLLKSLSLKVKQWIWIIGNHDHEIIPELGNNVFFNEQIQYENIVFSHDLINSSLPQVVGHYHPTIRIRKLKGKCFVVYNNLLIMPSFGSYTGGLDIESDDFKAIRAEPFKIYMSYQEKIWKIR